MRLEIDSEADSRLLGTCFKVQDLTTLDDLIRTYDEVPEGSRYLFTLEDIHQALYTSMHACSHHDLDGGSWLLDEGVDPAWLDGAYPREDLSPEQLFQIRRMSFERALDAVPFDDLFEKDLSLNEESRTSLAQANTDLLGAMDAERYLLQVPVSRACEALYAFPNGYFSCDLSPLETFRLAEHLEAVYGYTLLGLGASLIAFRKSRELTVREVDSLLALLTRLYAAEGDEARTRALFSAPVEFGQVLVLRYTG